MSLRQAAQQALEALENPNSGLVPHNGEWCSRQSIAITALQAALAEPEQEPVAYFDPQEKGFYWAKPTAIKAPMTVSIEPLPLYSAPTPRKPLTDEEISVLWEGHTVPVFDKTGINPIVFARAIERAHGIGAKE